MIISYPGGAGGNWLRQAIDNTLLTEEKYVNFHIITKSTNYAIGHFDKFDLLLSGNYYFNFYANHVYKFFHKSVHYYTTLPYDEYWLSSVSAAFWICEFDKFIDRVHFNYNHLIDGNDEFYTKIVNCQQLLNKPVLTKDNYDSRRIKFIDSCVNVNQSINNFNDAMWVSFILGQLQYYNIVPDFSISKRENYSLCQQFAIDNIHHCKLLNFHESGGANFILNDYIQ